MSISGINSSMASSIYSGIAYQKASSEEITKMTQQQTDEILAFAEVDQETRDAIQQDLKAALGELMEASDGEKPTPETLFETIKSVFSEHGLDVEAIMNERFGSSLLTGENTLAGRMASYQMSLFDILDSDRGGVDTSLFDQRAEQMSEQIMDLLMGIDEEA